MLSWFRKGPRFIDREFDDLAAMLTEDETSPTYRRELLLGKPLDFSVESLRIIDEYLEALHIEQPAQEDLLRPILRAGAYVGEVIRRHSRMEYHWISHEEAAKFSPLIKGWEQSIATVGILWSSPETMMFPLSKVCKYLENGSEDSVYFFAQVTLTTTDAVVFGA